MPININPIRKAKVKQCLLNGKSARQALKEAGYSKSSIQGSTDEGVVKASMKEILEEAKASDITVELVIKHLEEDRQLAFDKGDISTMVKVDELLGKYKAMFTDKIQQKTETYSKELIEDRINRLNEFN